MDNKSHHRLSLRWAQPQQAWVFLTLAITVILSATANAEVIDRRALVTAFSPTLNSIDMRSPFTLGNGKFAFT